MQVDMQTRILQDLTTVLPSELAKMGWDAQLSCAVVLLQDL